MSLNTITLTMISALLISTSNLDAEWLRVPVKGTGTRGDMYRPDLPPGVDHTVTIDVGQDGKPLHPDCFVWVPDRIDFSRIQLRPGSVRLTHDQALKEIQARNPKINSTRMEQLP